MSWPSWYRKSSRWSVSVVLGRALVEHHLGRGPFCLLAIIAEVTVIIGCDSVVGGRRRDSGVEGLIERFLLDLYVKYGDDFKTAVCVVLGRCWTFDDNERMGKILEGEAHVDVDAFREIGGIDKATFLSTFVDDLSYGVAADMVN